MKKAFVFVCMLSAAVLSGQDHRLITIDLSQISLDDLNPVDADLSRAQLHFAGPIELMISNITYEGVSYAALLRFDGIDTVEVLPPFTMSPEGMPSAIDLSEVRITIQDDGLYLSNVIADGFYFSGNLVPTEDLNLVVAPPVYLDGIVEDRGDEVQQLMQQLQAERAARAAIEQELAAAQQELSELGHRPAAIPGVSGEGDMLHSGWIGGTAALGSWSLDGRALHQQDGRQVFAKYVVPIQQNANHITYTFNGRGETSGRAGFGLHILASRSANSDLYGFGSSYLVWVTRNPASYGTEQTFVQVYRSRSDVDMVEVANVGISSFIGTDQNYAIHVDRPGGIITVSVNGEEVLQYTNSSPLAAGSVVAARAMGEASFSDLAVYTH